MPEPKKKPGRPPKPKDERPAVKTITDICAQAGISLRIYHYWKQLPEFPRDGTPEERLRWCEAKAHGRMVADVDEDDRSATDWRVEKEKWQALKNKQAVEQERLKIVLAAREELLSGIVEVLERMRKRIGKAIKNDPATAAAINAAYSETIAEIGSMSSEQ